MYGMSVGLGIWRHIGIVPLRDGDTSTVSNAARAR